LGANKKVVAELRMMDDWLVALGEQLQQVELVDQADMIMGSVGAATASDGPATTAKFDEEEVEDVELWWGSLEHDLFLIGMEEEPDEAMVATSGGACRKISQLVGTRTPAQCEEHRKNIFGVISKDQHVRSSQSTNKNEGTRRVATDMERRAQIATTMVQRLNKGRSSGAGVKEDKVCCKKCSSPAIARNYGFCAEHRSAFRGGSARNCTGNALVSEDTATSSADSQHLNAAQQLLVVGQSSHKRSRDEASAASQAETFAPVPMPVSVLPAYKQPPPEPLGQVWDDRNVRRKFGMEVFMAGLAKCKPQQLLDIMRSADNHTKSVTAGDDRSWGSSSSANTPTVLSRHAMVHGELQLGQVTTRLKKIRTKKGNGLKRAANDFLHTVGYEQVDHPDWPRIQARIPCGRRKVSAENNTQKRLYYAQQRALWKTRQMQQLRRLQQLQHALTGAGDGGANGVPSVLPPYGIIETKKPKTKDEIFEAWSWAYKYHQMLPAENYHPVDHGGAQRKGRCGWIGCKERSTITTTVAVTCSVCEKLKKTRGKPPPVLERMRDSGMRKWEELQV
jgi:hypothetical protein